MNEKDFTLTLTEEQAGVLVEALDLYSRVGMGQFESVIEAHDPTLRLSIYQREETRQLLQEAKSMCGHPPNGSYGIHSRELDDRFRVAWDIQQVVRHAVAWSRQPSGNPISVNFDEPRQSSEHPLPRITRERPVVKEDQPLVEAQKRLPIRNKKKGGNT